MRYVAEMEERITMNGDDSRNLPRTRIGVWGGVVRRAVWWVRQVTGDAAYENYLRCVRRESLFRPERERKLLSREEFYLDSVRRRYSTPSRCC